MLWRSNTDGAGFDVSAKRYQACHDRSVLQRIVEDHPDENRLLQPSPVMATKNLPKHLTQCQHCLLRGMYPP